MQWDIDGSQDSRITAIDFCTTALHTVVFAQGVVRNNRPYFLQTCLRGTAQ